jgi:formylglycine-generating enzyme required for sulfatase activity
MERRVLISYASEDPDWTPEQVEAVATAIEQTGLRVHLDRWHQRDRKRRLSLAEWQAWMDASIDGATHIICLVSARYRELWSRKQGVPGGYGVAFESIRLIHHLYLLKQHNDGRILTLRPDGHGYDHIPRDLALDCPDYCWAVDRDILLSHLGEAELPRQVGGLDLLRAPVAEPVTAPPTQPTTALPPVAHTAALPASPSGPYSRPAWASDSGKDAYGRWADVTIRSVTQRMRWIPPTAPERFKSRVPTGMFRALIYEVFSEITNQAEHPAKLNKVSSSFWLADTPCTQAFWEAVMGNNPSNFKCGADAPQRPVDNVSWNDVMEQFIVRLAATLQYGTGERLCLPTSVEWEHAARAGATTAYWWGDVWDDALGNADVIGKRQLNDNEGTTPVKRYSPNPWGLYDLHGNVWEWCADVWQPRRDQDARVLCGGSWFDRPVHASAASRDWGLRSLATQTIGFRFALRSSAGPEAQ